jgi:hypothetical protein
MFIMKPDADEPKDPKSKPDDDRPEDPESHLQAAGKPIYTCPMHPEVHQEKPGNCPKCGMTLVPKMSTTSNPG